MARIPQSTLLNETPTRNLFLGTVLERQPCGRHNVPRGVPCFHVPRSDGSYSVAICNKRARKAGMDHHIRAASLTMHRSK